MGNEQILLIASSVQNLWAEDCIHCESQTQVQSKPGASSTHGIFVTEGAHIKAGDRVEWPSKMQTPCLSFLNDLRSMCQPEK